MKKIILCSLLMIGVFNKAIGQEKLLTKDDAISLVLEQNFGILIAKNTIDVASNNKSLLNSGYLPTLSGTSNANYNKGDRTSSTSVSLDVGGVVSFTSNHNTTCKTKHSIQNKLVGSYFASNL